MKTARQDDRQQNVIGVPEPGAPFGRGPRNMLGAVLKMDRMEGLHPAEYTDGVIRLALEEGQPDLGIWLRGDIVREVLIGTLILIIPLNIIRMWRLRDIV